MERIMKGIISKRVVSGVLSVAMLTNFCTVMPVTVFAEDIPPADANAILEVDGNKYQLFDLPMN